ncbi:TonB family protein [Luteimonas cucumeris]|uniref:TonB family protein n=1 Tax=Luteimonas cucumeris TaxID=985012 RepID=A0A562L8Q8_9GAMM|nr:energy transducer TonB [Luteimonas cucumeris]TWI03916.1 TonB family protein [Luteimonas cucumeris]
MSTPPNSPGERPAPVDRDRSGEASYTSDGGAEPPKRGGSLLWLLLLVALLLLGWWWFTQRSVGDAVPEPLPEATAEQPATTAASEATVAEEARKKAAAARDKPRKAEKPATPRITEARPIASRNPRPEYPREALRRGQSGHVLLRVDVAADGTTSNVDFVQRSGSAELDRAAMNAVRKWQFSPARRNGKAVASRVNVPVDFVLPPD